MPRNLMDEVTVDLKMKTILSPKKNHLVTKTILAGVMGTISVFWMCFFASPIQAIFHSGKELIQGKNIARNIFLFGMITIGIAAAITLAVLFPPSAAIMPALIFMPFALKFPAIILAGAALGNMIGKGLTRLYNYFKHKTVEPNKLDVDVERIEQSKEAEDEYDSEAFSKLKEHVCEREVNERRFTVDPYGSAAAYQNIIKQLNEGNTAFVGEYSKQRLLQLDKRVRTMKRLLSNKPMFTRGNWLEKFDDKLEALSDKEKQLPLKKTLGAS